MNKIEKTLLSYKLVLIFCPQIKKKKKRSCHYCAFIHSVESKAKGERERDKTTQAQTQHNSSNLKFHNPQTKTDRKTLANLLLHADLNLLQKKNKTTKLHSTQTLVHKPKQKQKQQKQRFHSPHVSAAGFESGSVSPALLDPKNDIVVLVLVVFVFAVSVAPSFDRRQQ